MSATKEEKTITIWDLYKEEDFIDAKDSQGDWRVGYIIAKLDHLKNFKVHFDGWSSKYDQNYKHNSLKLRPFRTIVIGYTGQIQNAALREDWKFSMSDNSKRIEKMKSFAQQPQKHSVHNLNQLLRGHNYLYSDFLMTNKFHTVDDFAASIQFFQINIMFLVKYMSNILRNFSEYLKVISNNQELQLWTSHEAYYKSYFQVFDTAYIIWGSYSRNAVFFKQNSQLIKEHFKQTKKQSKKIFQYHITKLFIQSKGLQVINEILIHLTQTEELIPFLFLHSFTNLISAVYSLVSTEEKQKVITQIIIIAENNLSKLKDVHLKQLHKHQVTNFFTALISISAKTTHQDTIQEWTSERELQFSLKLITCPYFDKKLKGIAYLFQICEKSDFILKNGCFKRWSQKVNLYDVLFSSNDNQQFARKACELIKFLYLRGSIIEKDIDLILAARIGKHETVLKQIYTLVSQIALYQNNLEQKLKLYNKISGVPQEDWDDDYIHMIRQLSENCYGLNYKEKLLEPFGFYMVYRYAVRAESEFALIQLSHILHRVEKSKIYNQFQEDCFKQIDSQNKTWVHIKILLNICHNRIDTFDKLQSPLIKILVKCITDYSNTSQAKIVEDGLELLTEVAKNTTKQMQVQQVGEIWKNLVKSDYREIFMRWLFKKKENGRVTLNHSLNQDLRKYLLQNLWNDPEQIKSIDENEGFFFVELFKSVNISEMKMSRVNIVIRPLSFDLQAYPKLWNVLKFNTKEEVSSLFCDLLAQIHTCFQNNLAESIQNLVETISINIRDSMQNGQISYVERMLKLTQKLINRDEQIFPWSHLPRMNYYREYTVHSRENGDEKVLRFNCMSTFYQFKKIVSQKFNIALHRLQVFNSRQELVKLESYFKTMNQLMLGIAKFQISEDLETESIVKTSLNHKLDLFFELLDDKRIQKVVWSIVERLPISDQLKFKLIETEDLLVQLNKVGFYKQLYQLKVVTQLSEQWWERFVSSSNLAGLVQNFAKVNFKTHIELEYVDTLTEIIEKMLNLNEKQMKQIEIDKGLAEKIFNLLKVMLNIIQKEGSKSLQLQIKIIKNLFLILEHLKNQTKSCLCQKLVQYQQCQNLLILGLIKATPMAIRKQFYEQMKVLINEVPVELIQVYLGLLLGEMLPLIVTLPNDNQLKEYFLFTSYFLSLLPRENISSYIVQHNNQICKKIFDLIQHEQPEHSAETPNMLLSGCLALLKYLSHSEQPINQNQIAQFIIHKCLFAQKNTICKSKQSRSECFGLLRVLICLNSTILHQSIKYLCDLHKTGQWRTKKLDDWTITLLDKMKSPTGYVGIKNLGCICYMNSFMQQLFMVPRFRYALTSCEEPDFIEETHGQNLLYQVQKMFLNLWVSDKKFYTPQDFCHAFKDYEGNPTNVTEQMDIDQFSNILFDRLENQMRSTNRPTLIKDMFGGVFSNQIVCKGCPHYSETQEHFLSISLTVKNKKNIYQSLDTMIKGDTLDGDNAYFCERCNKKVSAVKRVSLKKLPDYLIVTLKRFEFDYEKMIKLKVNEYCQFPKNLNLKEYSQQFLRKQQSTKVIQEDENLSNDYFSYVLKGVVVHLGYADSGHYYSYIQDRNTNKWFEFNDTIVRDFNIDDLAQETFGGETSGYEAKQKIKNAYMLIYQRQKKVEEKEIQISKQQILANSYNQSIMRQIMTQNREQKIQSILFSEQYHRFFDGLIDHLEDVSQSDQEIILKYIVTVYLTISVREKSQGGIYSFLKKLNTKIEANDELKEWIVSLFSQKEIFDQFFKNCVVREVKKLLSYWLVNLFLQCNRDCQQYFCNIILTKIVIENENILENCLILFQISKNHGKSLDYLVKNGIVGRYLENIVRKDPRIFVHKLQLLPQVASQIGNQIIFEKSESDTTKKLRLDNENGYVWGLINLVIARSRQLNLPLQEYITPIELGYLKLPDSKILKILEQNKNKFQMYEFINLLCFLSIDNQEFLSILTRLILQGLKQFQSKRYRQFFILFEKLISVQDELKQQRLQAFRNIQQGLIHNEKYSLDSNIIQQWIIILINRNQNLRNHIQKDSNVLNFLLKGCTKKIPSEEVARKNNVYSDFMINKLHGVKFPRNKKGYYKLSEDMTNFYEQLTDNTFEQSHIWPSVMQTETANIKVGDVVAYFDLKDKIDYEQAKVESIFMGRLELHLKKNRIVHLWKDDEKISLDIKFVQGDEQNEINSSRTTQMEIQDQQDYFDEL